MAAKSKSPRLGRGLSALMAHPVKVSPPSTPAEPPAAAPKPKPVAARPPAVSPTASAKTAKPQTKPQNKPQPAAASKAKPSVTDQAAPAVAPAIVTTQDDESVEGGIVYLSPLSIRPNPHQPRRHFDQASLERLAASIKDAGLMQPIIVRPASGDSNTQDGPSHEIVAGERRWRAAQLAGLETLPAIVRDLDERQSAQWALVENLQREDLNPMERAEAFAHLISEFGLSHEQIAHRVGVDRSTISNLLRFIDLDAQVKDWVRHGTLSAGQARALAGLSDKSLQRSLGQKVIAQEMSVRQVEAAVKQISSEETSSAKGEPLKTQARSAHLADLEQQISQQLETKVRIRPGRKKGSGTMSIDFYSVDQFDTLLKRLAVEAE